MSDHTIEPGRLADLRRRAASTLTGGAADKGSPARIADALSSLYKLASSPQTAHDALALLHELQVHQVELELQAEELVESRAELESALRRQVELYDSQPVGLFTIDARLVVQELNRTGASMLGIERDDGCGVNLGDSLPAGGRRVLTELVARAVAGAGPASCALQLSGADGRERSVQVNLRAQPGTGRCFAVFTESGAQ